MMPKLPPEAAGRPRRRGDVETTPGRCANLDYCSIGMQRVLVAVPVSQPFICPECGGRLRPPGRAGSRSLIPALRIAVLVIGIGLGIGIGYLLGRSQPAMKRAVATASRDTVDQVNAARSLLGLSKLPADAVKPTPAETPATPPPPESPPPHSPPPPAPPPVPPMVEARAFPAHAAPIESADPPVHLSGEQNFGQVTIDCELGAVQTQPTCRTTDLRGADAFSARALPWLQGFAVQYPPGTKNGAPALLDHRWRVIFEDFAGGPPAASPRVAPPAAPQESHPRPPAKSRHRER